MLERVWFHLTNSYNSDGQWPPTTKASPHIIYPFNYKYKRKFHTMNEAAANNEKRLVAQKMFPKFSRTILLLQRVDSSTKVIQSTTTKNDNQEDCRVTRASAASQAVLVLQPHDGGGERVLC